MTSEAAKQEQAQLVQRFGAPVYDVYYPVDVWNEILPGLHLGGTGTSDDMNSVHFGSSFGNAETLVNKDNFDTVVTPVSYTHLRAHETG
jgi:hypothetical protein